MKRLILIFAILISGIGVLIMASPMLLRLTGLDEPVKSYLLSKVMKDGQGSVNLDEFRIGLGTLELNNVSIEAENNQFALRMPTIRFDFHFHEFFLHPTNPQVAIKSITIVEPILILRKTTDTSVDTAGTLNKLDSLIHRLNRIEGIEQVLLEKGSVFYRTMKGDSVPFLTDIDGEVSLKKLDQIHITADASLLSSQDKNCNFDAILNLEEMCINSGIELFNYQADQLILPVSLENLDLEDGLINGKISVEMCGFSEDSIRLKGNFNVTHLAATFEDLRLQNTRFRVKFDQQNLSIQGGEGLLNGSAFVFGIEDNNIFGNHYQAEIQFSQLSLAGFFGSEVDKDIHNLRATLDFDRLKGQVGATLSAVRSEFGPDLDLTHIRAKLNYVDQKLHLLSSNADIRHAQISASGFWDLRKEKLALQINAVQQSGVHIVLDRLSNKMHDLRLNLRVDTKSSLLNGKWDYSITAVEDSLLEMSGRLGGRFDAFEVELLQANYPSTQAFVRFINILSNPEIENARLTNFPITAFMSDAFIKNPLNRFNTDMRLRGKLNNLSAQVTFIDKENERNDFRLSANILNILQADKQVKGGIEIKNLMGFYDFKLEKGILNGLFDFPAGIKGNVQLDLVNDGQISGGFNIKDFCIPAALSDTMLANEVLLQNHLSGRISLGGTIKDPNISAQLNADRFVFNDKGYYQAQLSLKANKERLLVDSLKISLNNLPFIEGNFIASFSDRMLSGNFSGDQMDVVKILETMDPQNHSLSGSATYAMSLGGTFDNPKIAASGRIVNGVLAGTDFSRLDFHLTDTIRDLGKFYEITDHQIAFSEINLVSEGEYSLKAEGNFPLQDNTPLDVDFHFKGDALKFLPGWVSFFEGGTSITDINLSLGGTRSQLKIKSGLCQIDRGELWMKAVAPHVEDIHGTIELQEGTNQVNIKNLKASVDGQQVTLNTVRNISLASGRELKNWYFKTIDLDFGILSIVTDKGGVELNIPGLMRKNESGHLYLSGKTDAETFYFAGPVKHPTAYGTVTLYDAWLTYPFILPQKRVKKKDIAVEFLENMDWDVKLFSGNDVRYRREIPAYIDNVNTELYVDESSPGLDFSGIISDGTFRPLGKLNSSRGRLEYLDQSFKVDFFSIEFTEWDMYPLISGRAWTTIRDSVGAVPKTIYLRLYAVDEETKSEKAQGSLENFRFKLESADPQIGEDQEQVLSYMGFSVTNIKDKATSVGGAITERYLFRPLLRPIERALEQRLGVDMVRINSNIAKNLFYSSFGYNAESNLFFNPFTSNASYLFLMQSSDITIGKYISKDIFLTYTGQLVSVYNQNEPELDFNHSFGVEYRFLRNVLVEFEYDRELSRYYRLSNQKQYIDDFKVRLRHSFTF